MNYRRRHQNRANTKSRWPRWGRGETLAFRRSRKKSTWYMTTILPSTTFVTATTGNPVLCPDLYLIPPYFSFFIWTTGASADTWQHQGASAGEHHQWLWPGALQESPGPCIWRPGTGLFPIYVNSSIRLLYISIISFFPPVHLNEQLVISMLHNVKTGS